MTNKIKFGTAFLLLISCFFGDLNAQAEKTSVGILPFTYVQGAVNTQDVNSIQESVTNAFVKTKRFDIVDRSKMEALKNEKELQKSEDFIDGSVVAQGASLGAQFLISGRVISAEASQETYQDSQTGATKSMGFKAKLAIQLQVIDVTTGQVQTSETIEPKGGSALAQYAGVAPTTAEAAMTKAIKDIGDKIDEFVAENFPVSFAIVEIQEQNKGKATKILIAGGSDFGVEKGDKLKVVEVSEIEVNGKMMTRKKEIGQLKISKVEDENFSTCSVSSGGDVINSKFDLAANLKVTTLE